MTRTIGFLICLLTAATGLSGCTDLPAETESFGTQRSDLPVVSLCYTGKNTTREALRQTALSLCPEGTSQVSLWDHDTFFNDCPLSRKNRVTFQCVSY